MMRIYEQQTVWVLGKEERYQCKGWAEVKEKYLILKENWQQGQSFLNYQHFLPRSEAAHGIKVLDSTPGYWFILVGDKFKSLKSDLCAWDWSVLPLDMTLFIPLYLVHSFWASSHCRMCDSPSSVLVSSLVISAHNGSLPSVKALLLPQGSHSRYTRKQASKLVESGFC